MAHASILPSPDAADGRLIVEAARAHNHEQLGRVVDESIERSAQIRREQQARDEARRREERRQERLEETERIEQQQAERTADRRREDQDRQEAIDAQRRAVYLDELSRGAAEADGPLDLTA